MNGQTNTPALTLIGEQTPPPLFLVDIDIPEIPMSKISRGKLKQNFIKIDT